MSQKTKRKIAWGVWWLFVAYVLYWMNLPAYANASTAAVQPPGTVALTIVTVPHLPTARFSFDGQRVTSDYKGVVRLYLPRSRAPHKLKLLTPIVNVGDTRAEFVRWWGQPDHDKDYQPTLAKLVVNNNMRLQVAFRVSYLVNYRLVNQNHRPIDPHRIQRVVIRSDTGEYITTHGGQVRLTGFRPALQGSTMAERQAVFSLWEVVIDGSNAVHQGQKRFLPSLPHDRNLVFVVPLKSIHITARDKLLGRPAGTAVILTLPNKTQRRIPFGPDHQITIDNLVRGDYRVHLVGIHGIGGNQPLSLSRNQNVNMRVWDLTDVGLVLVVVVIIAAASLLGGRLGQRSSGRRTDEKSQKEAVP